MIRRRSLLAACPLALAAPLSLAQSGAVLQPLSTANIADALARPLGAPVTVPRTRGTVDLSGKRFYLAEYRVLIEQSGEQVVAPVDGRLLGLQLPVGEVTLSYRAQPDLTALQALVDRAWADLQARLLSAGVALTPAEAITSTNGAIFEATEAGSSSAQPVITESKQGDTLRRHLVFAPTGTKLVRQVPGGLDVGNLAARLSYPRQRVEALSVAMAVNLSALDTSGRRISGFAPVPGVDTLSPQLELGPAPQAALVHAHAQRALVNLNEALLLTPEFGRLRAATPAEARAGSSPLQSLIALGRSLTGTAKPQVDAVLELDGLATSRLLMYALQAGNQAVADTLKAALNP